MPMMYGMMNNGWGNRNGFGGNGYVGGAVNGADLTLGATTQAQVNNLSDQIRGLASQAQDNHNADLINENIAKTQSQFGDINMGIVGGFANVAQDINGVQSAVQTTGCNIKSAVTEQGYQNQLANCQQTNTILMGNQALQNTVQNGFTALGYQLQTGLCDAKQNSTANTQRIVDTLNNHWNSEQQSMISQLRDEVTTLNQTNALIAALKPTTASAT